ncbi:hypothetical protein BJY04DRAFT_80219 [Aspergillus karnatakaensis]|uniref:uncharacterized protein n=1 Tax=Aspergillus karnatakaensis TaxID=1810916 RepID=UPI003CCD076B
MNTQPGPRRLPIYLRFGAMVASLASVIAFGYSQDHHDREVVLTEDMGGHVIAPVTGTVEYTLIWSLIIGCIELAHKPPIHPGIYVAFDLIAWIAPTVTLALYLAMHEPYFSGDGYNCGRDWRANCIGKQVASVEHFGTAMGFLAVIIHFMYFVWACIATDRLRKSQRAAGGGAKTAA